uniref:DDE-1 domain-containing protein n=1 Tax=Rhizophagus irregularis (strain DAOM 181602 / DAOM 197198 / MUCL 43194) TaxID=747089 RepID=U9T5N0_RHIID
MAKVVKRQHASYFVEQKRVVVIYTLQHRRNSAAKHFEFDTTMVRQAEEELYTWVLEQRKKALAPDMVALYGDQLDFIATFRWLTGFMKRYKFSFTVTYKNISKTSRANNRIIGKFASVYKTSVWFDIAENITINPKEEKTVHVCRTGNEKNRFTIVLTYGTKLSPICIFKEKQMPRGEKVPSGVVVLFQENGWMNVNLMKRYIDYFNCIRMLNNQSRFLSMMVYDSFRGHLEDSIKEKFKENNVNLAVIPGGLTSICQPLDVAINKPFKDHLHQEWHQ